MKKNLAVAFLVFSMVFISCDQDYNTLGADLVGDEHFDMDSYNPQLKAYSVSTGEVQTNNLPINPLGFYNNPFFGQTKANFVTQAALAVVQPKFGTSVQVENVTLYVPYFCTAGTTDSDGETSYTLDSIYGANPESKMKLSVYENGYFLSNLDPLSNFEDAQRYYSNSTSNSSVIDFDNLKRGNDGSGNSVQNGTRLNDDNDYDDDGTVDNKENDQFFFDKKEIVVYKTKFNTVSGVLEYVDANDVVLANQNDVSLRIVKERLAPGIYLTLNKEYFKKKILEASSSDLFSNNDFRQYFKGLYFKMEQVVGQEGAMAMLNFNKAKLNVNYSSVSDGASAGATATSKTFVINIGTNSGGNNVSLQEFTPTNDYSTGLSNSANDFTNPSNPLFGQNDKLYVKGGKGSVVYMDVFGDTDVLDKNLQPVTNPVTLQPGNGIPDELDQLRLKGWLINDAYLEFYVDKTKMTGNLEEQEPERLYLFDATNQKALVDYSYDSSTSSNSKRNKLIYGGIVERDNVDPSNRKAVKYKIRITQHINNLINSTNVNVNKNVRLGLCVTESIALTSNFYYKNPLDLNNTSTISDDDVEYFPVSSIMAQQGVVLHGTNPSAPENASKKLKLTIHFTKPN